MPPMRSCEASEWYAQLPERANGMASATAMNQILKLSPTGLLWHPRYTMDGGVLCFVCYFPNPRLSSSRKRSSILGHRNRTQRECFT